MKKFIQIFNSLVGIVAIAFLFAQFTNAMVKVASHDLTQPSFNKVAQASTDDNNQGKVLGTTNNVVLAATAPVPCADCNTPPPTTVYSLTVSKVGTGLGTVTSSPVGINCGSICSATYTSGVAVTLTATPATGSVFSGWSGVCTGTGSCTLTMNSNKQVTATFNSTSITQGVDLIINDVAITRSSPGPTPSVGDIYLYGTVTLKNLGDQTAIINPETRGVVFGSINYPPTDTRAVQISGFSTGTGTITIGPGGSKTLDLVTVQNDEAFRTRTGFLATAEPLILYFMVDAHNNVSEANETNNVYTYTLNISPASGTNTSIKLISPQGGEQFSDPLSLKIQWSTYFYPSDRVYFYMLDQDVAGKWSLGVKRLNGLGSSLAATGTWGPTNYTVGSFVGTHKIRASNNPNEIKGMCLHPNFDPNSDCPTNVIPQIYVFDDSDMPFTVGSIKLISPQGGEQWAAGSTQTIKWQNSDPTIAVLRNVQIYTNPVGSSTVCLITNSIPDTGLYSWTIPTTLDEVCKGQQILTVLRLDGSNISGKSNIFTINSFSTSQIKIITPNGGEQWVVDKTYAIGWSTKGVPTSYYNSYPLIELVSGDSSDSAVLTSWRSQDKFANNDDSRFGRTSFTVSKELVGKSFYIRVSVGDNTGGLSFRDTTAGQVTVVTSPPWRVCAGSPEIVRRSALGTDEFGRLGLDTSKYPEILRYRIQWFSGGWSDWYIPGVDDVDWKTNNDGTKRRVWAYFGDHTHEFEKCDSASPGKPDLIVKSFSIEPSSPTIGQSIVVKAVVKNIGTADASIPNTLPLSGPVVTIKVMGPAYDYGEGTGGTAVDNPPIKPGATATYIFGKFSPIMLAAGGSYEIKIMADGDISANGGKGNIIESNEANNTLVKTIIVDNKKVELKSISAEEAVQQRIQQLEYKVSELERQLVETEKSLTQKIDQQLTNRVAGKILLQVEGNGEAWYVDKDTQKKFYLKDGNTAYTALQAFGLGISNENLAKIPVSTSKQVVTKDSDSDGLDDQFETAIGTDPNNKDTDGDGYEDGIEAASGYSPLGLGKATVDANLVKKLEGKIILAVNKHGEAFYISNGIAHYLKDGVSAYQIMRNQSLGITNDDLRKIQVGEFE